MHRRRMDGRMRGWVGAVMKPMEEGCEGSRLDWRGGGGESVKERDEQPLGLPEEQLSHAGAAGLAASAPQREPRSSGSKWSADPNSGMNGNRVSLLRPAATSLVLAADRPSPYEEVVGSGVARGCSLSPGFESTSTLTDLGCVETYDSVAVSGEVTSAPAYYAWGYCVVAPHCGDRHHRGHGGIGAATRSLLRASNDATDFRNEFGFYPILHGFLRDHRHHEAVAEEAVTTVFPLHYKLVSNMGGSRQPGTVERRHPIQGQAVMVFGRPPPRTAVTGSYPVRPTGGKRRGAPNHRRPIARVDPAMRQRLHRVVRAFDEAGAAERGAGISIAFAGRRPGGLIGTVVALCDPLGADIDLGALSGEGGISESSSRRDCSDGGGALFGLWASNAAIEHWDVCVAVVDADAVDVVMRVTEREGCPASVVGAVSGTGRLTVRVAPKTPPLVDLPLTCLTAPTAAASSLVVDDALNAAKASEEPSSRLFKDFKAGLIVCLIYESVAVSPHPPSLCVCVGLPLWVCLYVCIALCLHIALSLRICLRVSFVMHVCGRSTCVKVRVHLCVWCAYVGACVCVCVCARV
eukprot:GHVU01098562.1.p1 GENE.GHVU01098562.1~~GHVU01098562.1.p1  ORF type:complete len:577 (-),score=40.13 GHVU01098562.1:1009-2739(-)